MVDEVNPNGEPPRNPEEQSLEELFPEPSPEKKAEIDAILGPDFARRVREKADAQK